LLTTQAATSKQDYFLYFLFILMWSFVRIQKVPTLHGEVALIIRPGALLVF